MGNPGRATQETVATATGASDTQPVRKLTKHIPLGGSLIGMVLILGSIALFFERASIMIGGAAAGILALLAAVWYAAHPFFQNTRRYLLLRAELVRFIGLARELNGAVVSGAPAGEVAAARSRLHDAVERIVAAAGQAQRRP